ncbi:hypothetical protein HPB49_024669 [Dermacentor silvarum]|uniref:Uncharacterized protein n=1 Tax=Dermacentor silvarum TaxID=543639 RepID=A0ACB8C654_DERSI|nr:hypothetical protein HPB49_024669 [Dermacentor silvarum]
MASRGKRYTLRGFTQELDWRPLHFVEPIPAHRICNACGVLPRATVCLPCGDVLCKSCYEQCLLDDGYACLLDGDQFLQDNVEWIHFPLENLLKRKPRSDVVNQRHRHGRHGYALASPVASSPLITCRGSLGSSALHY